MNQTRRFKLKPIFFISIVLAFVSCSSKKTDYSGKHGGQLYTEGDISVEVVESSNSTMNLYFYRGKNLIPTSKISLKDGLIDPLTPKGQTKVEFSKNKDHFIGVAHDKKLEDTTHALLNFQMSEGKETQEFVIPL